MDAEPEYNYVRGKGWVIGTPLDTFVGTCAKGKQWRVEVRYPCRGEIWDACWSQADTAEKIYDEFVISGDPSGWEIADHNHTHEQDFDSRYPVTFVLVPLD